MPCLPARAAASGPAPGLPRPCLPCGPCLTRPVLIHQLCLPVCRATATAPRPAVLACRGKHGHPVSQEQAEDVSSQVDADGSGSRYAPPPRRHTAVENLSASSGLRPRSIYADFFVRRSESESTVAVPVTVSPRALRVGLLGTALLLPTAHSLAAAGRHLRNRVQVGGMPWGLSVCQSRCGVQGSSLARDVCV